MVDYTQFIKDTKDLSIHKRRSNIQKLSSYGEFDQSMDKGNNLISGIESVNEYEEMI